MIDRCAESDDSNHVYRYHGDGCNVLRDSHHHCAFCGKITIWNDVTKGWK